MDAMQGKGFPTIGKEGGVVCGRYGGRRGVGVNFVLTPIYLTLFVSFLILTIFSVLMAIYEPCSLRQAPPSCSITHHLLQVPYLLGD